MIITISGMPGSGKSTVAKLIAKKLGYKAYSAGDFRGEIAMERGIDIDQLNEIGKREFWTDKKADERTKKLGETEDNFVIDGWVAFHFIPHSFKVFIDVDPRVGAERIFKDPRPDEPKAGSVEEIMKITKRRIKGNDERYKKYYNVDFLDKSHYDLVIDSSRLNARQVADRVLEAVEKQKKKQE